MVVIFLPDHNMIKKNQVYALSKLDSKELYMIQVLLKYTKPTSQRYFEKHFSQPNIDWKKNYILPRVVTVDNRIRVFHYKLLNNILFLNKMLFKFGIASRSLCSFYKSEEETPFHIFHDCNHTQNLWNQLQTYISETPVISCLTPQSAMFGFIDTQQEKRVTINHLLLIFKFNVYKSRDLKTINFLSLNWKKLMSKLYSKQRKYFKNWGNLIYLFCHWTMYLIWKRRCFSLTLLINHLSEWYSFYYYCHFLLFFIFYFYIGHKGL